MLAAAVAVALLADLHVRVFKASAADASNRAYAAVRGLPEARLLELPVFLPDVHYGSVYLYYDQRVRRQRPAGYSTTAPRAADEVARMLEPLTCGDWTTGAGRRLDDLDVTAIALHRGLYAIPNLSDTSWLAWQSLVANGWQPLATDGVVTSFGRGSSSALPPFQEPSRDEALFCAGWYLPDARGHQMRRGHAAFWVYGAGILRLFLASPEPLPITLSVDGSPRARLTVQHLREARVGLLGARWHLVSLDTDRLPEVDGKPRGARVVAYVLPQS